MQEQIANLLSNAGFGSGLVTFFVSMLPVVELRLGIPMGVSMGLPVWQAAIISVIGNLIPVPFIIAFIRTIMNWMRVHSKWMARFVAWLEKKATGPKAERVRQCEFWGLVLLVAIPLPGTGAWTGALIAALLDIRMKRAVFPIVIGVIIAALIVSLATSGVIMVV